MTHALVWVAGTVFFSANKAHGIVMLDAYRAATA